MSTIFALRSTRYLDSWEEKKCGSWQPNRKRQHLWPLFAIWRAELGWACQHFLKANRVLGFLRKLCGSGWPSGMRGHLRPLSDPHLSMPAKYGTHTLRGPLTWSRMCNICLLSLFTITTTADPVSQQCLNALAGPPCMIAKTSQTVNALQMFWGEQIKTWISSRTPKERPQTAASPDPAPHQYKQSSFLSYSTKVWSELQENIISVSTLGSLLQKCLLSVSSTPTPTPPWLAGSMMTKGCTGEGLSCTSAVQAREN